MSRDDPFALGDLMTVDEVTKYLNIHRSTVLRLAKGEHLPGFKVGLKWRFYRREIDEWRLARTARKPT
jgi:excisionase family DNA binding protein